MSNMTAADTRPRLAMLLGDMTGIGPEIVARVLADGRLATWHDGAHGRPVLWGGVLRAK